MTARSTNIRQRDNIVSTTQKPMKRNSGTTCSSNCDAHPTPPCGLANATRTRLGAERNPGETAIKRQLTVSKRKVDERFRSRPSPESGGYADGVDITSITLKRQANTIIPSRATPTSFRQRNSPAKRGQCDHSRPALAHGRSGIGFEHIDGLSRGFPRPPCS